MKTRSKILAAILTLAMVVSFVACNNEDSSKIQIGVLKWVTHGALDASEQGFVEALKKNGYIDGENIAIDYQNANNDASIAATASDRFVNNKMDLILGIATPALQSLQSKTETIPLLGTAVTDYVEANLAESNEKPGKNITGTSDLTPIAEQFDLLLKVLPDIKKVGIIYNSSEDNSRIQADTAKEVAESKGLAVEVKTFSTVNDIPQVAESLAKSVEAIWLPTDNTLASAMSVISEKVLEKKIPLVCGEENMVAAGGTFTIGIDYYKLGYQTGEMAVRILKDGTKPADIPIEYQKEMAIAINKKAADQIGLSFPQDVLDSAKDVSK